MIMMVSAAKMRGTGLGGLAALSTVLALGASNVALAQDDALTIGMPSEITSIDPHFHNLSTNLEVSNMIFEPLVGQDAGQQLVPALATSWEAVDDTTWEFALREGVTFHDGSAFTADDVVCSFERAPDVPNSPSSFGTYIQGKSVEKVDDLTVRITTEDPYPLVPNDISQIMIVSDGAGCDAATEAFNSSEAAVGTGPYRFGDYVPGDRVELTRHDDYWGEAPEFATVVLKPIKSDPARVAALLSGDVDMIAGVPTTDIATLEGEDDVTLAQGTSNRVIYLHMDQFREDTPFVSGPDGGDIENPLLNEKVRVALSKAIHREAIRDRVMEGQSIAAGQLLPEGFFGVSPDLEPLEYDPEGAKELLTEAGYPDGFTLTIHGPNDRYINDAKIIEAIAQMWSRIGVDTSVETLPRSVFFSRASSGGEGGEPEFSVVLVGWGAGSGEASSPLRSLIHTFDADGGFGASNRGRYSDPEVDALIEEALATVDDEARQNLLAEATEKAIGAGAIIPVHFQVNTWAMRDGLGYEPRTDEFTLAQGVTRTE